MPVKTVEHQAIASLHRLRSTWLATRTARLHTIRGLSLQRWAAQTEQRRGRNVAAVAVANKLARIVGAVWVQQRPFAADHRPA